MTSTDLTAGKSYLFDTTFFIDVLRKNPTARKLLFQGRFWPVGIGYSILTEAELWVGVKPHGFTLGQHIILLKPFHRYFINVTIARRGGELLRLIKQTVPRGQPIPQLSDCIIAASAEYYGLTVCTRNSVHFGLFPQFSIDVMLYT